MLVKEITKIYIFKPSSMAMEFPCDHSNGRNEISGLEGLKSKWQTHIHHHITSHSNLIRLYGDIVAVVAVVDKRYCQETHHTWIEYALWIQFTDEDSSIPDRD